MKTCLMHGDMTTQDSVEDYPKVNFCDDCYKQIKQEKQGGLIVQTQDFDLSVGTECFQCGKAADDE